VGKDDFTDRAEAEKPGIDGSSEKDKEETMEARTNSGGYVGKILR
jgi:hypothetical protein